MIGPFGGYGSFIRTEKNRSAYDIDASVDAKPAADVKVIAYMPGCEVVMLDIPIQGTTSERQLPCKPLAWIPLHGQISPASLIQAQPVEIEIEYLALWDHRFFGIMDGLVTSIRLGTVLSRENGEFDIQLPDFYNQASMREGAFGFTLRGAGGRHLRGRLEPTPGGPIPYRLEVRSSYAPGVQFIAKPE